MAQSLRVLLALAAAVIVLVGLWLARELVGPLAVGAVMVIICAPVGSALRRRGAPNWLAATAIIVLAYLVLAVLGGLLAFAVVEFIGLIRDVMPQINALATQVYDLLVELGASEGFADHINSLVSSANVIGVVSAISSSVLGAGSAFFFILAYVIFMAADAGRYARAEGVLGERIRPVMERIRLYCRGVRRYFVVNASFGVVVAIVDGVALWLLDVPVPVVWAILSFVTNFIPNIGFVLGMVPPAILALVVNDWVTALIVVVVYIVANVTLQVMVQPKFVSDAVGLSLTLSFFSVVFWTFVIGPLGAILSIPLTLLVRSLVLEGDPQQRWLRWFSGDDDAAQADRSPAEARDPGAPDREAAGVQADPDDAEPADPDRRGAETTPEAGGRARDAEAVDREAPPAEPGADRPS